MNLRYILGALISIPVLPLMYYQGKRIRASVPKIPPAIGDKGLCSDIAFAAKPPIKLIAIGESTIAGVGVDTHTEGFTGTAAKEISKLFKRYVAWKVYAKNGYTAKKVRAKIVPSITEEQVDLILVGLGGNDAFKLNRPLKWNTEIRLLIDALISKFPDASIVFCNMPPIKEFPAFTPLIKFVIGNLVELLGKELRKIVANYNQVYYIDEIITLAGWIDRFSSDATATDFFSDGVHPSKLAYQAWAKDTAANIYTFDEIRTRLNDSI